MNLGNIIKLFPTSRFVATAETAGFPTQIGKTIYTGSERPIDNSKWGKLIGPDLTWQTALGATVWLFNRWCFYIPLFFWRQLK